ncbi:glycosyltransferase [Bosea sp. (in: a-proteobacteria)]|uniref:glycosyltransferase n=1 Tax=Bosea sp. (in: a-proteobacteria) TaxID=1871050 RepID=UPI0026152A00|nr:glycosyltransferase [Bosea sp. (in: a-proteobacteria)]MCO5090665.1 glycosyltransferase [Bosea sp. (in: a-proteobacteria)]
MLRRLRNSPVVRALLRPVLHAGIDRYFRLRRLIATMPGARLMRRLASGRLPALPMKAAMRWPLGPGVGRRAEGHDVVMLVVSDLRIDPRVEREARALARAGYAITVICPDLGQGELAGAGLDWGPGIRFDILPWTAASFVNETPGFLAHDLYERALDYRPFAYHAHDLNTAFAGLAAARMTGAHLIADFHEWTSENVHWDARQSAYQPFQGQWKQQLQGLEARCLAEASSVITVCDSIADAMASELGHGRRPVVVRNIPMLPSAGSQSYPPLKRQLGLADDSFVLLWQGGTGPTRLIEPIIEALALAPRCTFVIRGPSLDQFGPGYQALAGSVGAAERLILLPPVRSRDVVAAAYGADAGIWTLPSLCRNFTYALPNKIFEYMASRLPVLVAAHPEARQMVERHGVGLAFDPYDPADIAAAINRLIDDPALAARFREATGTALAELDPEREWEKVVAVYDGLREARPQ